MKNLKKRTCLDRQLSLLQCFKHTYSYTELTAVIQKKQSNQIIYLVKQIQ